MVGAMRVRERGFDAKLRIAVYADEGAGRMGVDSIMQSFSPRFSGADLQLVYAADICNAILDDFDCLIIPGGADLPYCEKLGGAGSYTDS